MAKTPGQPKRGKGGRFVAGQEPAPEGQEDEELSEENDWSRGEGFGSIGPAAFGTPSQQASLGDLQALQAGVQDEQAKARAVTEATGAQVGPHTAKSIYGVAALHKSIQSGQLLNSHLLIRRGHIQSI